MQMFDEKVMPALRAGLVALVLTLAIATGGSVSAQTATEVPVSAQAQTEDEDDGGFDDWGLLGLLGLLGLAGLRRRPDHAVGTVDRDTTTRSTRA